MRLESLQLRVEPSLELTRAVDEIVLFEQVHVRKRSRAARGMAAVGRAVREAVAFTGPERLRDVRRGDDTAKREIAAGHALGEDDQIRPEVEALDRQPFTEPPEAVDHDVGDRQDPVATAELLDAAEVAGRRWVHPARADHRFVDECSHVLWAKALDLRLERVDRFPRDSRGLEDERPEFLAVGQTEDARADAMRAVVAGRAADQVSSPCVAGHVVIEPRELGGGLDRVAAAAREEDLRPRLRSEPGQTIRKLERRPVCVLAEDVEGIERRELRSNRVGDLGAAVTDVRIPEARCTVEVTAALLVPDEHTLPPRNDELSTSDVRHVGERMPERCRVDLAHRSIVSGSARRRRKAAMRPFDGRAVWLLRRRLRSSP